MHSLVYHVPKMIEHHGNIKQFSGQGIFTRHSTTTRCTLVQSLNYIKVVFVYFLMLGVENNNNDAKRNYFSSNLHDVFKEVIKAEWRLKNSEKHDRRNRKYDKKDDNYWNEGTKEQRKRPRSD